MKKLTKVQQAVLDAVIAHGYIHSISWDHSSTTSVPGYPHRVGNDTLLALRTAKLLAPVSIPPRGTFPDGRVNNLRVSVILYVPTEL